MQKKITVLILLLLASAIILNSCEEPPTEAPVIVTEITGKVFDKESGTPLNGVQITTLPVTSSIITGTDGSYTLTEIDPGNYKVTAQKDGYNTNSTDVTVAEGKSISADILLSTQTPELGITPETLDFEIQQTSLTFNITNTTNIGEVSWSIGVNQPWLSVSPSSGSTTKETDFVTVTVDRDSLNYGNYSALITISSDYGTKHVNVVMVKTNPNAPQLSVTPNELDFGNENITKTILVKNTGSGTLTWQVATNDSWFIFSPTSGSTQSGEASSLSVSLNKNGLSANNYNGLLLINSDGGSQEINVSMVVQDGTLDAPELQIIETPTNNSISLAWSKIDDSNFADYKIYRSIFNNVDENNGTLIKTITNKNENKYTDENLNSGTTYYYTIYAYSSTGIGSASNEVSATTKREIGSWISTATIQDFEYSDIYNDLAYIEPIAEDDVWLTSNSSIYHYNGSDWSKDFVFERTIRAMSFTSSNSGWVLVADQDYNDSYIYSYNGISWTKGEELNISSAKDMIKFNDNNIWIISDNAVYNYNGTEWKKTDLDFRLGSLVGGKDLYAISENEIWAIGGTGTLYFYNGVGWDRINGCPNDNYYRTLSVFNSNDIWIESSYDLQHFDGNEWVSSLDPGGYGGVLKMISSNEGWYSRGSSFYYYDGNDWSDVQTPVSSEIIGVNFLTRAKGWAVTENGTILRYVE